MVNVLSVVCFSTLLLSNFVAASTDDHVRRSRHHNAARVGSIQRRAAEDHHAKFVADRSVPEAPSARRKRANGRCSARTSTSSLVTSTTKTTSAVQTTAPIVNPGGDPTTKAEPTTTSHNTTKKPVEKPATTSKAVTTTKASGGGGGGGNGGGSGSGTTFHGDGTYYGTGLGACGITNKDTDYIVAVSQLLFDNYPGATANPNNNPVCNKRIVASFEGKSVTVTVVDRCVGCAHDDLDFSPSAFSSIANQSLGRIQISWQWAD